MGRTYRSPDEVLQLRQAVLQLRDAGVGPREIARRLGVSPGTVTGLLLRAGRCDPAAYNAHRSSRERVTPAFKALVLATAERDGPIDAARQWGVTYESVRLWRIQARAEAQRSEPADRSMECAA